MSNSSTTQESGTTTTCNELSELIKSLKDGEKSGPIVIEKGPGGKVRVLEVRTSAQLARKGLKLSRRAALLLLSAWARTQNDLRQFWNGQESLVDQDGTRLTVSVGEEGLVLDVRPHDQRTTEAMQQTRKLRHEIAVLEKGLKGLYNDVRARLKRPDLDGLQCRDLSNENERDVLARMDEQLEARRAEVLTWDPWLDPERKQYDLATELEEFSADLLAKPRKIAEPEE